MRVALIGLGHQGHHYYLPLVNKEHSVEFIAICDSNPNRVKKFSKQFGIRGYVNYVHLLQNELLDFIIIATPHDTHSQIIREAANRGVAILKEKPFARNLREAREIRDIIRRHKVQSMISLPRRFDVDYLHLSKLARRMHPSSFVAAYGISRERTGWRNDSKRSGGGCILDMGYNLIDILLWMFGVPKEVQTVTPPERNLPVGTLENSVSLRFFYPPGFRGTLFLSSNAGTKYEWIIINGRHKTIALNRAGGNDKDIADATHRRATISNSVREFSEVLQHKKDNSCSPQQQLSRMLTIDACYKSLQTGKVIRVA